MATHVAHEPLPVGREAQAVEFGIARHRWEREDAFRLIYQAYLSTGLAQPSPYAMRLLPHHLLHTTDVFVAQIPAQQQVVATVSLVRDGRLGLPMDSVYDSVLAPLRWEGKILGEVSCLADKGKKTLPRCMQLFRWMVQTARVRGIHALVIAVHPKHARFYERWLAFERIGGEAAYPSVCDRPAVALVLDFDRIDRERPANYERFFAEPIPRHQLLPHHITDAEREHLSRVLADTRDLPVANLQSATSMEFALQAS